MNKYSTVLFDLDGTVADTAPDLKRAADHVLSGLGRRTLSEEEAYRTAPLGMTAMLKASLGDDIGRYDVEELKTGFLRYYRQNIHAATRLYPGIREVLSAIRESQLLWGIVTNKPMFLTEELVASFPELSGPAVIIAGDSVVRHKPDPEPVLRAIELTVGIWRVRHWQRRQRRENLRGGDASRSSVPHLAVTQTAGTDVSCTGCPEDGDLGRASALLFPPGIAAVEFMNYLVAASSPVEFRILELQDEFSVNHDINQIYKLALLGVQLIKNKS